MIRLLARTVPHNGCSGGRGKKYAPKCQAVRAGRVGGWVGGGAVLSIPFIPTIRAEWSLFLIFVVCRTQRNCQHPLTIAISSTVGPQSSALPPRCCSHSSCSILCWPGRPPRHKLPRSSLTTLSPPSTPTSKRGSMHCPVRFRPYIRSHHPRIVVCVSWL